ncbi:MAG: Cyclopropane-fatty-acyl-phospholipid synthase [Frankiales bacterium]|nr:Cyclopropane-fatty-acyl-phospholipid synthase [Frankiales bacterium]
MKVADALAAVLPKQTRVEAYDGSAAGPSEADIVIKVQTPQAISHMVSAPGELGMARAYIAGDMDVEAPDHYTLLRALTRTKMGDLTWGERLQVLRSLGREALHWVEPPPQEVGAKRYLSGLRAHSKGRDAAAIAHHHDVSNTCYEWVLGPSMAYTCALFPTADATLEEAQFAKFDLVCQKLALRPGMRLLDVGCGWGGMAMHAAEHYGVEVVGATLSRQQAEWGRKASAERGLSDRVDIRFSDYRDVRDTGFDAISSIGLTEHIGIGQLSSYASFLAGKLVPQGRLLNHCITRNDDHSAPIAKRGFIPRYVFPDGELPGVGRIIGELQRAGLEVRHEENLREHYALTLQAWCDNLDAHWDEAVAEVGMGTARVWALYLAGSRIGFEINQIQLHQVLAVKSVDGTSGFPLRPAY